MKKIILFSLIGFVYIAPASVLAAAAAPAKAEVKMDWSTCTKEIDKYCKRVKGKSDRKIYECLSEHDEHHDNGLSKSCDENGHTKYETLTGLSDANEGKK